MRFLYLLLVLTPFILCAQPTHQTTTGWQELTISDGLSQGMIFDLKQDQKDFLWVATKDGLNRYDGHNFKVFTHDPYNKFSVSDNACSALLIDRKGRLWVGTLNKGLNLYDDKTQRFYHVTISNQASVNAHNYEIEVLDEDPDGNIWVGTSVGTSVKVQLPASLKQGFPDEADFTSQVRLQSLNLKVDLTKQVHLHFSFRDNGQALTGLSYNIYSFNWRNPTSFTKLDILAGEAINLYDLYEDIQQNYLFVSTNHKIRAWHAGMARSIALPGTISDEARIKPIDKNTLAISTVNHLWLMSADQLFAKDSLTARDAFVAFPPDLYAVTKILKDRTGNIWAGTSGYGLRKFNPRVKHFHSYLPRISPSQLYADRQGRTYVRSQFAYKRLDRERNQLVPMLDERLPEADRRQRHFIQDRQGFFWVSNTNFQTHEQHLFKFSSTWQLLKKYPLPAGTEFGFWGNQSLEDPSGHLWIGVMGGKLLRFDPRNEAFQLFTYQAQPEMETYALLREPDGSFWIGTQQGLIKANHLSTKPVYAYYRNSTTDRRSLSNDFVLSLTNDPDQPSRYLWVGTRGGGLDRMDKQTGHFEHFTEVQGLPNNVIYGMLVDEFHHLWLSTNRGLSQFNPRTKHFRNYTRADGLQGDEFNTGSFFKTSSGELLFGGVNGLNTFRPAEFSGMDQKTPMVNIIGLKVNNKPVEAGTADQLLTQGIEYKKELNLSHDQNLLTFEFGVMDYTNSANNRYRYRLKGIDQDWVEAGTNRFANYAQLPDGRYELAMMGSADGEHWSKPVELRIWVHPPFYRTWWAYLLYALLVALGGWRLYVLQMQRLLLVQQVDFEQKEAIRLAELDALKTQFFTNISHEFRTPLTLIQGPLTDLRQRFRREKVVTLTEPVVALMEQNSHRLLSLINQLLDLSKLEAGQLQPEFESGDISAHFRALAGSFSSLAESRRIQFTFTQDKTEYRADFDWDKIEKIITNLLSNAFKFTPEGHRVRMHIAYPAPAEKRDLTLTIEDTGIGIALANLTKIFDRFYQVDGKSNRTYEGTGIGLALVHELVRVLKGHIGVTSTEGLGTTFTLTLPLMAPTRSQPSSESRQSAPFQPEVLPNEAVTPTPTSDNILLIIDDNADIRSYVRSIFEPDYQVLEAVDGLDGLEKATGSLPDLIICDLMMPRLNGFGLCKALKNQEATSHIPVVMLTAKATVEDRIEGFEQGADDYLTKPFNRREIKARVSNLIGQRQRLYKRFAAGERDLQSVDDTDKLVEPTLLKVEQQFLDRLTALVTEHIDQPDFSVGELAEGINLSRTQLHRKLKALTNASTSDFIREIRLTKAAELLANGGSNVTQVAYTVGFNNLSYFAQIFQDRYGMLPSQYGRSSTNQANPNQV